MKKANVAKLELHKNKRSKWRPHKSFVRGFLGYQLLFSAELYKLKKRLRLFLGAVLVFYEDLAEMALLLWLRSFLFPVAKYNKINTGLTLTV